MNEQADPNIDYQAPDGSWKPAIPIPLWVGWRLNTPSCCGIRFRGKDKMTDYEAHYMADHIHKHGCPNG